MAIIIKIEDILDKNNNLSLNKNIFQIDKITKIILKGIILNTPHKLSNMIYINDMFQYLNILNTLEFYRDSKKYFTLSEVLYANINNTNIEGSFAHNTYQNNENTIYVNLPFYNNNNCYLVQSIGQEKQSNHSVDVNNYLTIMPILSIYNTGLFKIFNLTKIISGAFFLYEYMMTELILFNYTNIKNLYFANVVDFVNYCTALNIHIENGELYKTLYNKSAHEIFQQLILHFNITNLSFNLPHTLDIRHHNFWHHSVTVKEGDVIPNCQYYQIRSYNISMKSNTYLQPGLYHYRSTYSSFINKMLNNKHTLLSIVKNNILTSWQHENLQKIMPKITFKNDNIYLNGYSCYLSINDQISSANYNYNLDNGSLNM